MKVKRGDVYRGSLREAIERIILSGHNGRAGWYRIETPDGHAWEGSGCHTWTEERAREIARGRVREWPALLDALLIHLEE